MGFVYKAVRSFQKNYTATAILISTESTVIKKSNSFVF